MAIITMDLETLPCADEALLAEVIASVKPPRTLKKAESIEAWWKDEGEAAKAEAISRTALDGSYGRICCIGWAIDDEQATGEYGEEATVIRLFFDAMNEAASNDRYDHPVNEHVLVGFNIVGFDLKFLRKRAIVNQIALPKCLPWYEKPWSNRINDVMLMWDDDRDRRISLDRLCNVLGVKSPKGDIDGSKIAQAWANGQHVEIAEYCKADVEATRQLWKRIKGIPS